LIAVTGFAMEQDHRRSKEAGISIHLTKPVEPSHLLELVRTIQAQRSGSRPDSACIATAAAER
jgi:CheY-like chemotaxis protein